MGSQSRFLSSFTILRSLPHRFSSSPFSSSFASFTSWGIPESVAYLRSMRRPPSTEPSRKLRRMSCSFIGTLHNRVQCSGDSGGVLRAFVSLEVKSDYRLPNSSCFTAPLYESSTAEYLRGVCRRLNTGKFFASLSVSTRMFGTLAQFAQQSSLKEENRLSLIRSPSFIFTEGELAEISLKHLKPNDFIYVSGTLGSHQKFDASGELQIFYKVYVQDLNYVTRPAEHHRTLSPANRPEEMTGESGPMHEKQHLDRMHLWQLFFASPNEWWDNRLAKRNPSFPDFRHKDTKECLWLSPDDPPWIRRLLEQYDASIGRRRPKRDANVLGVLS